MLRGQAPGPRRLGCEVALAEDSPHLVGKRAFVLDEPVGDGPRALGRPVGPQPRERRLRRAPTGAPVQLALTAHLEAGRPARSRRSSRPAPAAAPDRVGRSGRCREMRKQATAPPHPTRPRAGGAARARSGRRPGPRHVAFGTSTPTSITVVATRTSSSPAEAPHHLRLSADGSRPCSKPSRSPAAPRAAAARVASAARALSFSDSSISGQTTYAWRPAARCLRTGGRPTRACSAVGPRR